MAVISFGLSVAKNESLSTVRFHNIITHVQHLSFLGCHTDMTKLDQKEDARDCNKLLYVFEVGEFCIECSRKQAKT